MSAITKIVFNTDVYGNKFIGDGSMLTGLPSSNNNYSGNANYVVMTNNNGNLTDTHYLPCANGGFGKNVSAFNGVVKGDGSGNFSAAAIVDADIDASANISINKLNNYPNDNSKVLLADGTWNQVGNNQISDVNPNKLADFPNDNSKVLLADGTWNQVGNNQISDVNPSKLANYPNNANQLLKGDGNWGKISNNDVDDNAAINRNKLASGTPNYILVNDNSGNMSEAQYLDRDKVAVGNANRFCLNDNSGYLTDTAYLVKNGYDIELNPDSCILLKKDTFMDADKKFLLKNVSYVQTSNNTPTAIYLLNCDNNKSYLVKFEMLLVDAAGNSGIINGYCKVKHGNASTQPTASYIISNGSILDAALSGCEVQLDTNTNDVFKIMVVGKNATTIDWNAKCDFIKN